MMRNIITIYSDGYMLYNFVTINYDDNYHTGMEGVREL